MKNWQGKSLATLFAILSFLSLFTTADEHDHMVKYKSPFFFINTCTIRIQEILTHINLVHKRR